MTCLSLIKSVVLNDSEKFKLTVMQDALPPLVALRAFEAAGRHLSFKNASEELNVTPAAISQQIKLLEDRLGVPLFVRQTRALELTEQGQKLLPKIREGFEAFRAGLGRIKPVEDRTLRITAPPSFTTRWLIPRLSGFWLKHPDVALRIASTPESIDQSKTSAPPPSNDSGLDVYIRFGSGHYPGWEVVPIFTPECIPVCSPGVLQSGAPILKPEDLLRHVLIQDETTSGAEHPMDWPVWLSDHGVHSELAERGPRFSNSLLAIEAAINGQGVALALKPLIQSDLDSGRLVTAFEGGVPSPYTYCLVYKARNDQEGSIQAFCDWVQEVSQ
jgi:LysR family glycine cleavage system transcriptional activator